MNLQESWECFTDLINHEVNRIMPVRKAFNKKHDTPWMTRASLRSIKKNTHIGKNISINKEVYEKSKREARKEIKAAKWDMKSAYLKPSNPTAKLFRIMSSQSVKLENLWEIW